MIFDHILIATGDPIASAARLRKKHGLNSLRGPRLGGGMASFIVPLAPPQFLQYVYLNDLQEASKHAFGNWLHFHHLSRLGDILIGWSVTSSDLDADSSRVNVPILPQTARWDVSSHEKDWSWRSISDPNNISMFPILVSI